MKAYSALGNGSDAQVQRVVLLIQSNVFKLLLSMDKVNHLLFFDNISPLHAELLSLVPCVYVVEDSKLWSNKPGEVSSFDITKVKGQKELMVPDHVSDPFIMRPPSETRDAGN